MALRTFNDDVKQQLLNTIDNTRSGDIFLIEGIIDFFRDDPYVQSYNSQQEFYNAIIEKENTSKKEINRIFEKVEEVNQTYTERFDTNSEKLDGYKARVKILRDMISGGDTLIFESVQFLELFNSAKVEGTYAMFLADGESWRAVLSKDADKITDEEYHALALFYLSLNDEKEIEDFLRGMMIRDLEWDKDMEKLNTDIRKTSIWSFDQEKFGKIQAFCDANFAMLQISIEDIAGLTVEQYEKYMIAEFGSVTMGKNAVLNILSEKAQLYFRNINLLHAVKDEVYTGYFDLTSPPDSSPTNSSAPWECFRVIIDGKDKISIATVQGPKMLEYDTFSEEDRKKQNIHALYEDGEIIGYAHYTNSYNVYNMGKEKSADAELDNYIKEKKLKLTSNGRMAYNIAKTTVEGKLTGYGIKYAIAAGGTAVGVTPPGWIATAGGIAVSVVKTSVKTNKDNQNKKDIGKLLDQGNYASRFHLMVGVVDNNGKGAEVSFASTPNTQKMVDIINSEVDGTAGANSRLDQDERELLQTIYSLNLGNKKLTTEMILNDPETMESLINGIRNKEELGKDTIEHLFDTPQ